MFFEFQKYKKITIKLPQTVQQNNPSVQKPNDCAVDSRVQYFPH